jgi:DNA helicase-2/ATP-dependent DNA helicase PcrA
VAVLTPDNARGAEFVKLLQSHGLTCVELLNKSSPARSTAETLQGVLGCLADPDSPAKLSQAFLAWQWRQVKSPETRTAVQALAASIAACPRVEEYLWPRAGVTWPNAHEFADEATQFLADFRERVQRWQAAAGLPIDQLLLTLIPDLFDQPADIVRAYRFAVVLRDYSDTNPNWTLRQLAAEIDRIASNERHLAGALGEDVTLDPEKHRGEVVVATMHKAKGLEWDRVYLTALNNYDFPSGAELDSFKSEYWFVRDGLNLQAEALGQLEALRPEGRPYVEGEPSTEARWDYIQERLRLLYVGITRARRELIATWNTGKKRTQTPAVAFTELRTFWEQSHPGVEGIGEPSSPVAPQLSPDQEERGNVA